MIRSAFKTLKNILKNRKVQTGIVVASFLPVIVSCASQNYISFEDRVSASSYGTSMREPPSYQGNVRVIKNYCYDPYTNSYRFLGGSLIDYGRDYPYYWGTLPKREVRIRMCPSERLEWEKRNRKDGRHHFDRREF